MCGIAGIFNASGVDATTLHVMTESLGHRGPDDIGFFHDGQIGLGHVRLSILDPEHGKQPVANEDGSVIVIFNGEIFNYLALRDMLKRRGHAIPNDSDTAILPHMYEEYGLDMFGRLNGQFAIAIWDRRQSTLILARDRMGEKPLYYAREGNRLCFASECKAILKSGFVKPVISSRAMRQVFTYWSTLGDTSVFEHISSVPPGSMLVCQKGEVRIAPYWSFTYPAGCTKETCSLEDYIEELDVRLTQAIERRLLSDVPVSFYLSGGLDSSLILAIASRRLSRRPDTFSLTFEDRHFDESRYQRAMLDTLETNHHEVRYSMDDLPGVIRETVRHTETPLVRTGAFPMFVLARLVGSRGRKVVLSGEGSDELFGGYDLFREVKIRTFVSRNPDSNFRSALYKRVNQFVNGLNDQPVRSLAMYYGSSSADSVLGSHVSRWRLFDSSLRLFSADYRYEMAQGGKFQDVEGFLPPGFAEWTPIRRAQFLELLIFLPNYLLSSQGDRVAMAAGVECRYPFLDSDMLDYAMDLPDSLKLKGLDEKYILKKLARKYVPGEIINRTKFPYRAPVDLARLLNDEYIRYVLEPDTIRRFGIFDPESAGKYIAFLSSKERVNEKDIMRFMGILTTQVLAEQFM
ncbi:Asparagine synthetase [glutamine-hydrolyzing] 1 [compost metagenome]